jgi:hypothetical protein
LHGRIIADSNAMMYDPYINELSAPCDSVQGNDVKTSNTNYESIWEVVATTPNVALNDLQILLSRSDLDVFVSVHGQTVLEFCANKFNESAITNLRTVYHTRGKLLKELLNIVFDKVLIFPLQSEITSFLYRP